MGEIVRISLHLVIENILGINVKTVEILNKTFNPDAQIISPIILNVLADLPLIQVLYNYIFRINIFFSERVKYICVLLIK